VTVGGDSTLRERIAASHRRTRAIAVVALDRVAREADVEVAAAKLVDRPRNGADRAVWSGDPHRPIGERLIIAHYAHQSQRAPTTHWRRDVGAAIVATASWR